MPRSGFVRATRFGVALASVGAALACPGIAAATTIDEPACTGGVGDATQLQADVASVAGGGGTVNLAAGCTYTLTAPYAGANDGNGDNAFALIGGAVTINGNGDTIERDPNSAGDFRFFELPSLPGKGLLTLNDVTLEGGAGTGEGGAVFSAATPNDPSPDLVVDDSSFIDNSVPNGPGGAIADLGAGVSIDESTFSGNSASGFGGAVSVSTADNGPSTVTNSTFAGNTSRVAAVEMGWGAVTVQGSTFVGNIDTDPTYPWPAVAVIGYGTMTGSILADGAGALECVTNGEGSMSLEYDLEESSTTATSDGQFECSSGSSDQLGVSASALSLGPLQNNGGSAPTVGIGPGSAAYHFVPAADCPATDERGVPRPQPPASEQGSPAFCDAGAFEFEATPATITWAPPAPIQYGMPLSATQLDASATDPGGNALAGTFVYQPPAGTVLDPGGTELSVMFTPTNPMYGVNSASVPITVEQAATSLAAGRAKSRMRTIAFSATLTRTWDRSPIADQPVVFSIQGASACQAMTTSSGVASCTATGLAIGRGTRTYTASYAGNPDYLSASATGQL